MSSPHSKPISFGDTFHTPVESLAGFDGSLPFIQSTDRAIDAALKSVPLPEGLMTRLNAMASKLTDEVAGSVDFLGC